MIKKAQSKVFWPYFVVTLDRYDLKRACMCFCLQYSVSGFVLHNIVQNSHYALNVSAQICMRV